MLLFFFQAEDGIRDWSVTGVQTCALPISHKRSSDLSDGAGHAVDVLFGFDDARSGDERDGAASAEGDGFAARVGERSEERRVGKECWCRGRGGEQIREGEM